ncbi:hypothetical protein Pla163_21160 [Planctomycetes bacterium Pla163]|uniref:Uncharacterized protein n=1 Tax=Rohdeia mirabilis TaxID=2528008 RepID=A0A518D0I7_9BACT|nr:hypothetical protein Pla163_21160 [Planctomycetes bacterium Pla163]
MNGRMEAFAARLIEDAAGVVERAEAEPTAGNGPSRSESLDGASDPPSVAELAREAEELVQGFEPTGAMFGARWRRLRGDLAETGALIWMASSALGVPTIGWRHERRALEYVVRAVCLRGWGSTGRERMRPDETCSPLLRIDGVAPAQLPDLAADAARPRAETLALGLGFWLVRQAAVGARTVEFHSAGRDLLVRCDRGGDPCDELSRPPFGAQEGAADRTRVGLERRASTRSGAWIRLSCGPRRDHPANGATDAS